MANLNNDIEKYLRGELSPSEMHSLEQRALDDPFLAEALEGAQHVGAEHFTDDIQHLRKALREKARKRPRMLSIHNSWQWYVGIAASLLLLAVSSFVVLNMIQEQRRMNAETASVTIDDNALLADSVISDTAVLYVPERQNRELIAKADTRERRVQHSSRNGRAEEQRLESVAQLEVINENEREVEVNLSEAPVIVRDEVNETDSQDKISSQVSGVRTNETLRKKAVSGFVTVKGRVTNKETSEPLPGTNVLVKGTATMTVTDDNGQYELAVPAGQPLVFSMLGLKDEEHIISKTTEQLDVILEPDLTELSEVVVTATGIQKEQKALGYSVSSVDAGGLMRGAVTADGAPLPGINVVIKGTTTGTVTDVDGKFEIPVSKGATLVFSFIGLQTIEQKVTDFSSELNVTMTSDVTELSEIVVTTGSGIQNPTSYQTPFYQMATPSGGQRAFKKYLERNIKYPIAARDQKIEGRATIEFTVEADGQLSNFKVVNGVGGGCDEELIRVIKAGPKWNAAMRENQAVREIVKVRYKFELD